MSAKIRVAGIILSLLVLAGLILLLARPGLDPARIQPIVLVGAAWIVFGCAAWLVRKVAVRLAAALILAGGIALQVVALAGPPQNSSDLYRYIWDGRVQATGIDPYLYPPSAAGVVKLRNDFLWSGTGPHRYVDCVPNVKNTRDPADSLVAGCTKLNRPRVPTVYPPAAEAYFFAVQIAAPADNSTTPIQGAAAAFAVAVTFILLFGLRKLGKDPRLAALWAWCPTVALEAGQNGHVDVVGVALAAVALLLLARTKTDRRRTVLGGVLIGLAIATKVTPVLVVPAVLRRGWLLISASVVAAISLVYVPHVIAVGSKIIGFFPGYLHQEGYSTGSGFSVIGLFVHGKPALLVAIVILGAIALAIFRFGNPDEPWRGGVLMTAAALAVTTPDFQWYAILLVMLVALDGSPEWLMIAAGGYLANTPGLRIDGFALHPHQSRLMGYGGGAAIAFACALVRYFLARRAAMADQSGAAADLTAAEVAGSDAGSAADAVAVSGETPAGSASGSAPVDVVEPTAIFPKSKVSVIIGANGIPEFDSDGGEPTSLGSTPGRFPRLIR